MHPPKPAHTGSCEFANPSGNTTGSTNYVIAPVSHGPPFTISFWVVSPLAYKSAVIGLKSSTGTEKAMQIVLGATATGVVIAQTTYTAGAWSVGIQSADGVIAANVWCHIAYTVTWSGNIALFVNGNQVGSTAVSQPLTGYDMLYVGNGVDGLRGFSGFITDVKMYGAAQSASFIYQDYYSAVSVSSPDCPSPAWSFYSDDGTEGHDSCLLFVPTAVPHPVANSTCPINSHLATMASESNLYGLLSFANLVPSATANQYFIGCHQAKRASLPARGWSWFDGTDSSNLNCGDGVLSPGVSQCGVWLPGEPNDGASSGTEAQQEDVCCFNTQWNALNDCKTVNLLGYLCELDVAPSK